MHKYLCSRAFARAAGSLWVIGLCLASVAQLGWAQPPGWTFARPITVTENSGMALTGYQLKLSVDTQTLIAAGSMNADGSDLRFGTDETGSTLLPYWIETGINTPTTTVWVNVDLPASTDTVIWMFSGNPAASSLASLKDAFGWASENSNSATLQVNSGGAGGVGNSQRGFRFSPNQDILVFQFGKDEPTGTTRYVTLFDFTTQAVLAQLQVSGPGGVYSYADLAQPIWLTQGTQYLLELYQAAADGYYFGSSNQINPLLTYYDMRYCNSCTQNSFPTNTLSNYQYGYPDFQFVAQQQISPAPTYAFGPALTSTDLLSSNPSSTGGEAVTFTATVNGPLNPTGTVTFYDTDGFTPLSSCVNPAPLDSSSPPMATCVTAELDAGTHSIHASYSGDASNAASNAAPVSQQVAQATSTSTLGSPCMLTFVSGQDFTLQGAVTGFGPSGDMTFFSGGVDVLCANVPLVGGSATCTTSALTVPDGSGGAAFDLSATYSGDSNNVGSSTGTLSIYVLDATDALFRNGFEDVPQSCPVE